MEFFQRTQKITSPAVVVGRVMRLGKVAEVESTLPAGEQKMMLHVVSLKVN